MNALRRGLLLILMGLIAVGCATTSKVENPDGKPTVYEDASSEGAVAGIGIESQDLIAMTEKMVQNMLANPRLAGRTPAPRIIVDAEYFRNESSSRINKNLITDRLRVQLNVAANGRLIFIGRHYSDMVDEERRAKREGELDSGTTGQAEKKAGADFRLGGRIMTLDAAKAETGMTARYHQIIFEMVDLETTEIVWGGIYEFRKAAQDDVIYR